MRTVSFYSYKGGAGRTLLLANFAHGLARAGQSVVAIDLDLEAPGLHYKIAHRGIALDAVRHGLVELIHEYEKTSHLPQFLRDYTVDIGTRGSGALRLLPAGGFAAEAGGFSGYWRRLEKISWPHLAATGAGKLLFLELRERIQEEFSPDYLLVDSQTGVTELGGIATAVLADAVVALALANDESLRGTGAIIRAVRDTAPPPGRERPSVFLVLTRQIGDPSPSALDDAQSMLEPGRVPLVLHQDALVHQTDAVLLDHDSENSSALVLDYLDALHAVTPEVDIANLLDPMLSEVATLERDDRLALIVRLGTIQLTRALLNEWLRQQQPSGGGSFLAALALTFAIAKLGTDEDLDRAVERLIELSDSPASSNAGEDDAALASIRRHWPSMSLGDLGDFLLTVVLARSPSATPAITFSRVLSEEEPTTALQFLEAALSVRPYDEGLLAALISLRVQTGDHRAALDLLGGADEWTRASDALRSRVAATLAVAAVHANDVGWAEVLLPDVSIATTPAAIRVALLHLTGQRELGEILLAAAIGEAQRYPSQLEDLIAAANRLGLGESVERLATTLLGAGRAHELLSRVRRPSEE